MSDADIVETLTFSSTDFCYKTIWSSKEESWFDKELGRRWINAMENGYFRYKLDIVGSKVLEGNYIFVAQLNPERGNNRRQPEEIRSMQQPFDPSRFNFSRVRAREVLFDLVADGRRDRVVINASPFEFGHSLLVPSAAELLPQVATEESLVSAVRVLLLSASPALRVGFNSLCGYASVNHLHYHLYYLRQRMLLETIDVQPLCGPCYEIPNYPGHGFVFQLNEHHDVQELARSVYKLTSYLQSENVAHNLVATRGKSFDRNRWIVEEFYDTVRVFVWARASSFGAKPGAGFSPALCELFGHLNVKDKAFFDSLTEETVANVLEDITSDTFRRVRPRVMELYRNESHLRKMYY